MLAILVSVMSANVPEKLADDKSTTNAESTVKEKRGIYFHSYASPYVYHSAPVVVHHAAPIIHSAPIIHHSVVSAPLIHHPVVAHPIVSHHVISHAPIVTLHHFKRR